MIETADTTIEADGPLTEVNISISEAVVNLEVRLERSGTPDGDLLGSWNFPEPPTGKLRLLIAWPDRDLCSVALMPSGGEPLAASSSSIDPESIVWPRMELVLSEGGEDAARVPVQVTDTGLLKSYYRMDSHQEHYALEHIFLDAFHRGRLRCLRRIFNRYLRPGDMVLEVGSGYSIFYMIREVLSSSWSIDLTCCDLDESAMDKMRALAPRWSWVVADALELPWADNLFDVLFAGEIIEHVPDPLAALSEWNRVLKPGGLLIISTPNRNRLLARARHQYIPVHYEHINEMTLAGLREAVRSSGFKVLKVTGVYLEFLINWWRPPERRADVLTARFNRRRHRFLYYLAMEMGRLLPSLAFDLVLVCRKP